MEVGKEYEEIRGSPGRSLRARRSRQRKSASPAATTKCARSASRRDSIAIDSSTRKQGSGGYCAAEPYQCQFQQKKRKRERKSGLTISSVVGGI